MRCTKNTLKETVWGTAGKRLLRRESKDVRGEGGRWPPPLWAHSDRQPGLEKMQQQPLQMTPWETGVATHDTNSTARTLRWEPDSHLYCQRKGYFWKMGPSPWFNSLTNPRKRGLSPREAVWFRLRLHFGLDLLSSSLLTFTQTLCHVSTTHAEINSVSISSPDGEGSNKKRGVRMFPARALCSIYRWANSQIQS